MKNLAIILLLFVLSPLAAQFKFESGYFISADGKETKCLIENRDWRFNPTKIDYKLDESSGVFTLSINEINEFGIDQSSKYVKATVDIDMSSEKVSLYSKTRKPEFVNKTVLLKVLIDADYTLFQYEESDVERFFLKDGADAIQPLIYKKYVDGAVIDGAEIKTNRAFLQVLSRIACDEVTDDDLLQISYKLKDLSQFIIEANLCNSSEVADLSSNKSGKSALRILAGVYSTSLSGLIAGGSFDFGSKIVPSFGIQYEIAMPYGGGKWSVLVEPTLFMFSADGTRTSSNFNGIAMQSAVLDYTSFDIAVGPRFNYFLEGDKKLFLNLLGIYYFSPGSTIDFETSEDLELGTGLNLGIGGGVSFSKLSAEVRFYTNRFLLNNYLGGENENPRIGLNISYRVSK